ncbi:unnamed protein product [Moneuplotes crassus]|uniref:Uncharacterized protein n=1 Tax=Euplotes crassus TaxID=5936 RepID=A0AAD1X481_EUPCR|nr:unnamed protein product [Moneuplotes crassus]
MADLVLCSRCKVFHSRNYCGYGSNTVRYRYCYSGTPLSSVCGMEYDINQTKEELEVKKAAAIEDLRNKIGEEGITFLSSFAECPICLQVIDSKRAVILSCCNKTWCIDCVLNNMKRDSSCSLCRMKINVGFFSKARYLDGIIETLKKEYETTKKVNCSEHSKDAEIFCDDCDVFICSTCIVVSHNGHKLTEVNAKYVDIVKKIPDDLEQMEKHISLPESVISKIKAIDEKNKDFLLFKHEQALSVLPEIFKEHHKKLWDLSEDYQRTLKRRKEYFQGKKKKIDKTIKEENVYNAKYLYQSQDKLKQEAAVLETENNKWVQMIKDSSLTKENKAGETVTETCDNLTCELKTDEETCTINLTSTDPKPLKPEFQKYLIFIAKNISLLNNDQNTILVHKFLSPITLARPRTISHLQDPKEKSTKLLIYRSSEQLVDYLINAHESLTSCLQKSLQTTSKQLLKLKKSYQNERLILTFNKNFN